MTVHHTKLNNMNQRGFTLIELVVAITMIGVLSVTAAVIINPLEQIKKTRDTQRKHHLLQIRNALEAYNADNNFYPASDNNKIKQGNSVINWGDAWQPYIAKLPKDPLSPTQEYYYKVSEDKTSYTVYAKLERSNDPQIIPGSESSPYNFAISSTNIAVAVLPTPTPTPTLTPTPTNTPTPTPTLVPGRDYKRVFVTNTRYRGNLTGLSGADSKCQANADSSTLTSGGRFMAWLSDSSQSPATFTTRTFIHATVPYKLVDGTLIANNWTDLITNKNVNDLDGNYLRNPIDKTQTGGLPPTGDHPCGPSAVWTNTKASGEIYGTNDYNNCSNWTSSSPSTLGSVIGHYGDLTSRRWTFACKAQGSSCETFVPLYCFEQ